MREDFTETVFWCAGQLPDPTTGVLNINFTLSDSITRFHVKVDAFTTNLLSVPEPGPKIFKEQDYETITFTDTDATAYEDNRLGEHHNKGNVGWPHAIQQATGASFATADMFFKTSKPFYISLNIPHVVTGGDNVYVAVSLVNNLAVDLEVITSADVTYDKPNTPLFEHVEDLSNILLTLPSIKRHDNLLPIVLPAEDKDTPGATNRVRQLLEVKVSDAPYSTSAGSEPMLPVANTLTVGSVAKSLKDSKVSWSDQTSDKIRITPRGFPNLLSTGGILSSSGAINYKVHIPDDILPGALSTSVLVYASPAANLQQALAALIRQPFGCFEQTSATTYPSKLFNIFPKHKSLSSM